MKLSQKQLRNLIECVLSETYPPQDWSKKSSFSSNDQRVAHIQQLIESGNVEQAKKLAWEWTTTKKFTQQEFVKLLKMDWSSL